MFKNLIIKNYLKIKNYKIKNSILSPISLNILPRKRYVRALNGQIKICTMAPARFDGRDYE